MRGGFLPKVDGYMVRQTLAVFAFCTVVLCFLVAVVDAFQQMDDFREFARREQMDTLMVLAKIGIYYFCLTGQYFLQFMVPFVLLLAGAIVASQMSASREFTALRASGVPLQRVLLPIPVVALLIGTAVFLTRDEVLPMLARGANGVASEVRPRKSRPVTVVLSNRDRGIVETLTLGHFEPKDGAAERGRATHFRLERQKAADIQAGQMDMYEVFTAPEATLHDGYWVLGVGAQHRTQGQWVQPVSDKVDPIPTTVTSAILEQQTIGLSVMTSVDLKALSADLDKQVELARRRAAPLAGMVILLVGLPLVVRRELGTQRMAGLVLGVILALLVCVLFYVFQEFCAGLAMSEWIWPIVGAWLPVAIFGVWGYAWFRTVRI